MSGLRSDAERRTPLQAHRIISLLLEVQLPVVCAVHGWAAGLGCQVALASDFTVAAEDMANKPGGMTYALLSNVTPNIKVLPIAEKEGGEFFAPTLENVYAHRYPLSRYVYIFVNRPPGKAIEPKMKEFMKLVLSRQGQDVVAKERVFIPLMPPAVKEELAKLE